MIDVTIPTTLRPEILQRTLNSFKKYCEYDFKKIKAICHIDPIPLPRNRSKYKNLIDDIRGVLAQGFKIYNVSLDPSPNFSRAVKWLWENSTAKYVLHLEDDWEFVKEIDLQKCCDIIDDGADYVRFPKRAKLIPEEINKVGLSPGLWNGNVIRKLAGIINTSKDPEKQLRPNNARFNGVIQNPKVVEYGAGIHVKDIGREWLQENGLRKWDRKKGEVCTWYVA